MVCKNFWVPCGEFPCCRRFPIRRLPVSTAAKNTQWMEKSWCHWFGIWLVSIRSGHSSKWPLASLQFVMSCLTRRRIRRRNPWIQFGCSWPPIPHCCFASPGLTSMMLSSEECCLCHSSQNFWRPCTGMLWVHNLQPLPDSSVEKWWPLLDLWHSPCSLCTVQLDKSSTRRPLPRNFGENQCHMPSSLSILRFVWVLVTWWMNTSWRTRAWAL